jgi:hypothetical protein
VVKSESSVRDALGVHDHDGKSVKAGAYGGYVGVIHAADNDSVGFSR